MSGFFCHRFERPEEVSPFCKKEGSPFFSRIPRNGGFILALSEIRSSFQEDFHIPNRSSFENLPSLLLSTIQSHHHHILQLALSWNPWRHCWMEIRNLEKREYFQSQSLWSQNVLEDMFSKLNPLPYLHPQLSSGSTEKRAWISESTILCSLLGEAYISLRGGWLVGWKYGLWKSCLWIKIRGWLDIVTNSGSFRRGRTSLVSSVMEKNRLSYKMN